VTILAGRYEIIGQLGGKGFAITFLAKDNLQPNQPLCVVKQLRPCQIHPKMVELFVQESTTLAELGKHPQIPQLWDYFYDNLHLYIVYEFVQGHDLSQEILSGKRSSENYTIELLLEVLEVLCFVHSQGVIHGDIKPRNLMRRYKDGKILLIDFGGVREIASLMVNERGEFISSAVIGTPGYMPHEQTRGHLNFNSDVYALGMTAIQAMTGIKPVNLRRDLKTRQVIWQDQVEINKLIATVINKMVRYHSSQRYPHAMAVLQDLILESPLSPGWSRRQVLQSIGFVGVGLAASFVMQRFLQLVTPENIVPLFNTPNLPGKTSVTIARAATQKGLSLKTFKFETVRVDKWGRIIDRYSQQAKFFTEDLGEGITLEMVQIPGGKFVMGSPPEEQQRNPDEGPQRSVTIKSFYMGKFVVTQKQYQAMMHTNPAKFISGRRPVEGVSWDDAIAFCQQLAKKTGKSYQLPSEAQWEYACRAGTTSPFYFGETLTSALANYDANFTYGLASQGKYLQSTTNVGSFWPNAFGLYDMHGLVWEWCQDTYIDNYQGATTDDKARISDRHDLRLLRGGSWGDKPGDCRCANRSKYPQNFKSLLHGFRIVLPVME
jgi:eukaryotic-like serine/threonine-protein kinase